MRVYNLNTAFIIVALTVPLNAFAQEQIKQYEVVVQGDREFDLSQSIVEIANTSAARYGETGEFIRDIPGVNAGRMGGHGLEPVIHGQQQSQLNVTSDGAFVHGGCPNRMDPPTAALNYSLYDSMTVDRGYQSVKFGPGGSGGSLRFERNLPAKELTASAVGGYSSNSDGFTALGNISGWNGSFFSRASGSLSHVGNYEDGEGVTVRSAYEQYSGIVDIGYSESDDSFSRLSLQYSQTLDALFAGAGMDSPETTLLAPKFESKFSTGGSLVTRMELSAYASLVDHVMDNYSLREQQMMFMRAPSASDTFGGRVAGDLALGGETLNMGLDAQYNDRSARRYMHPSDRDQVRMLSSILWPDTTISDIGVFAEISSQLTEDDALTVGARLDTVMVSADAAADTYQLMGMTRSPNMLYQKYYGDTLTDQTESNPAALITYKRDFIAGFSGYIGSSFVTRTADATERSIASDGSMGLWVGNPSINPEQHSEVRTGVKFEKEDLAADIGIYYDSVADYIFRDLARAQDGILSSDGANIYRNIDATLSGVDAQLKTSLSPDWTFASALSYTYGKNDSTGRPLPQIPPFNGWSSIEYKQDLGLLGVRVRYASEQGRVDDDPSTGSARDVGQTPEYGTVDLYAEYELVENLQLRVGITNLFDRAYANHLNRANAFDPVEIQVNEPGRTFFVGLQGTL